MAGYIIKVMLENAHPPVWRRLVIPEKISFGSLHRILQAVYQWEEEHLHIFTFPGTEICVGVSGEWSEGNSENEEKILADGFLRSCKAVRYTYDFGDNWQHKIIYEKEDPGYHFRYARVLKYKGDSYEEDCGGVWSADDEKNRIPFDIEKINKKLQSMHIPLQKESRESKGLLEEMYVEKELPKILKESLKKINEKTKRTQEKFPERTADGRESEMAKNVRRWKEFCRKSGALKKETLLKNISHKSSTELLAGLDTRGGREYCKYVGVKAADMDDTVQCAQAVWERLEKYPEYLAYVFAREELRELITLLEAPNGMCSQIPSEEMTAKAIALGFFDLSEEKINKNRYLVLRQTSEAKKLMSRYTQNEWGRISKKCAQRVERCNQLLHLYSMMELDAFCEKYHEYFGTSDSAEEILRCIYLSGTFCKELITGEDTEGTAYVGECYVDMNRALVTKFRQNIKENYRTFSSAERRKAQEGYGSLYPVWGEYYEYLMDMFELDDSQVEEWLMIDYIRVKNGDGAEVLWEHARRAGMLLDVDIYVSLWAYFLGVCMTTGLPQFKGYSREEYSKRIDTAPEELGIYGSLKTVQEITKKTHLYEMPLDIQIRLYRFWQKGEEARKIEAFLKKESIDNYETEYLLGIVFFGEEKLNEAEKHLKKVRKGYPGCEKIKTLLGGIEFVNEPENENVIWDMREGRMPKGNIKTVRREGTKIGRNDPCPCGSGKKYKKCCGR